MENKKVTTIKERILAKLQSQIEIPAIRKSLDIPLQGFGSSKDYRLWLNKKMQEADKFISKNPQTEYYAMPSPLFDETVKQMLANANLQPHWHRVARHYLLFNEIDHIPTGIRLGTKRNEKTGYLEPVLYLDAHTTQKEIITFAQMINQFRDWINKRFNDESPKKQYRKSPALSKYKQAYDLHQQGKPYSKIAKIVGCLPFEVGPMINRYKKKLKD